jgi:outer membrane protein assembly factor BamA
MPAPLLVAMAAAILASTPAAAAAPQVPWAEAGGAAAGSAPGGSPKAAPSPDLPAAPGAAGAPTPSRRYVIEEIRLLGLEHTRPSEVRRRLEVAEGEVLDEEAVLLSRLRLLQLGWFAAVDTRVEKGSERGLVVLVFDCTERNTLIVSDLVLGSTGPQPVYGGFGLSQGNFLGLGLVLSGAFVYGGPPAEQPLAPARFAIRAAFDDPDLAVGGQRLVVGLSGLVLRGEEFTCSDPSCSLYQGGYGGAPRLRYRRAGGEVHAGIRPGPFERLVAGFRLERVSAERVAGDGRDPGTEGPNLHLGTSVLTALTAAYDRDTRNDPFLATDGTRLLVNLVLGSQALGGDYEYVRALLQLETDHALWRGHALKLLGAAGAVQGDAPFFERFYAADFAYFSIGPALGRALELNFSTDSRYDAYLALLGAEYGVPLWASKGSFFHRGYLAFGARWLFTSARAKAARTPASRAPFSGDVALRLDTTVGSFNLSLGYALDNFL